MAAKKEGIPLLEEVVKSLQVAGEAVGVPFDVAASGEKDIDPSHAAN